MSINKVGTPNKILEVAKNAQEFSTMWGKIEEKNELVKCNQCKHLLSKRNGNSITLKHKKLASIITGGSIDVVCPICATINKIQ